MKTKTTIKRLLAIVLSLFLVFSATITAFAAGPYTITINNAEGLADMENAQFSAYYIFKGDVTNDSQTMTNIEWANATEGAALLTALKQDSKTKDAFADATNATQVAEVLESKADDGAFLQAFAKVVKKTITTTSSWVDSQTDDGSKSTITVNEAGYYLVVQNSDVKTAEGKNGVRSSFILQIVDKNTEVDLKADIPSVTKDVDDRNAGFGDFVQFTLEATLPDNFTDYDSYYLRFNDTLSEGLELAIDSAHPFVVNVAGTATTNYKTNAANEGVGSFYVTITDLKNAAFTGVTNGSKITVTYYAKVKTTATITETNKVDLTYSNDPNHTGIPYDDPDEYPDGPPEEPEDPDDPDGPGTGTTTEDIEYVHNYNVDITKKATDGKSLNGAKFYLIKDGKYATADNGKITGWIDGTIGAYEFTSNASGNISIFGLDAGTYTLKEISAPDGYGTIADVTFEIKATLSSDGSSVTNLTAELSETRTDATVVSGTASTHTIALLLTDPTDSNLPNTGGMGTIIFYIVGGMMVMCAGAYLVISKRKASAQ